MGVYKIMKGCNPKVNLERLRRTRYSLHLPFCWFWPRAWDIFWRKRRQQSKGVLILKWGLRYLLRKLFIPKAVSLHGLYCLHFSSFCLSSCLYLLFDSLSLREKCPNGSFFWSVFFCIRTEYGDLQSKSQYSVRIQENTKQKKLCIWTFFHAVTFTKSSIADPN